MKINGDFNVKARTNWAVTERYFIHEFNRLTGNIQYKFSIKETTKYKT